MKSERSPRAFLVLGVLALGVLGGCGKKRPPAVATAGPRSTASPTGSRATEANEAPSQPLDAGPDITPIGNEGALGQDMLSDASGEGGPLADILFEYDKSTLSDEARGIVEKHATWLQTHRDLKVTVEGHCDERGTVDYNLALGNQRAQVVMEYLLSLGVAAERMKAVSFGKERPLDPAHNEGAFKKNRRAHFAVSR